VIRCFNEEKHIGKLLNGIMQQTAKNIETIIVDSGSTDDTLTIAKRFPVKILSIQPEEFSFGRSLNIGCNSAQKEFIVIASAHVYPLYKDWIENLLSPFQNPEVSLVYGRQIGGETTKFSERQIFEQWFPDRSNLDQDHPFSNNGNAAIRRSTWQSIKYDETLTGLEDLDLAHKAIQAGHKIAYQSSAIVVHVHDEKPMQIFNRYRREAIALKRVFPNEKFTLWDFVRLFISNVINDLIQAVKDKILIANFTDILNFRFMQFWGTFRGFSASGHVSKKLKQRFYYPNNHKKGTSRDRVPEGDSELRIDYQSSEFTYHDNH
jgi:glycosyltransferase involved in cell wall biosynthesis